MLTRYQSDALGRFSRPPPQKSGAQPYSGKFTSAMMQREDLAVHTQDHPASEDRTLHTYADTFFCAWLAMLPPKVAVVNEFVGLAR